MTPSDNNECDTCGNIIRPPNSFHIDEITGEETDTCEDCYDAWETAREHMDSFGVEQDDNPQTQETK